MSYIYRVLIAIDQLLNVVACNGEPDETMSSAVYRMEMQGRFWGFMRPVIDLIFRPFEQDHCRLSFESEVRGLQLPKELRK